MTKFNPENKATLTIGETLSPAMVITDPEDAQQYFEDYVKFTQAALDADPDGNTSGMSAEEIAKSNLGYYAGYYDRDTRERVEELFACAHPVLGKVVEQDLSLNEILALGKEYAAKSRVVEEEML